MACCKDNHLFQIGDRRYEAVWFLREGENSVVGDEMLARTAAENSEAIGREDGSYISERRHLLPAKLRRYCLVTGMRPLSDQRCVSYFVWRGFRWCGSLGNLNHQWGEDILVVRRCA